MTLHHMVIVFNEAPLHTHLLQILHYQLLSPPPTDENTIYEVALTPYNNPKSAPTLKGGKKDYSVGYHNYSHALAYQ